MPEWHDAPDSSPSSSCLLTTPKGRGGFCAIAGSDKSNFSCPRSISLLESDTSVVSNPGAKAGDVIVFTEALAHGTLPWRNDRDRRVALYRFAAKTTQYAGDFDRVVMPDWANELTPTQRASIEPAHVYDHPSSNRMAQ